MKDAIYDRISTRTYDKKQLTKNEIMVINEAIDETNKMMSPFNHKIEFFKDLKALDPEGEAKRIGTYGFIKNATNFVGGTIKNDFYGIIDYGYLFEYFILKLTQKGLSTCWLAGTFDREAFSNYIKPGEVIPAITPIGYPEDKMSLRERAIRFAVKANRRKSFDEMFYLNDINHPLKEDSNHLLQLPLELVKLGPSASNKQPWRIIILDHIVHFYLLQTPNYNTNRPFVIQALDMGISLCHFEIGLKEIGIAYELKVINHPSPRHFEYIISFVLDK
jgi:nitroreductase